MFHIDLLTPYRETITHGPNYQRPPPNLVDNEEEYEVEKILDSWLFGRRKRLQYLVKWAGYPESENMWVDKDDVFAEDKVREFKNSHPDARTHIRQHRTVKIPHLPLASPSSSNNSYFLPYVLPMPNNVDDPFQSTTPPLSAVHDNLPATTPHSEAAAEFPSEHDSDEDIREAIRLLRIEDAPVESSGESPIHDFEVSVPNRLVGDADSPSMASRTIRAGTITMGPAQSGEVEAGYDSNNPLYQPDMRPCSRGCRPREYCHGHSPTLTTPPPLPIRPRHAGGFDMANLHLDCAEAVTLVADLSALIRAVDKDSGEVPPAYPTTRVDVR